MDDRAQAKFSLLDEASLLRSAVVANCRMNRERTLTGANGYVKELGFDLLDALRQEIAGGGRAAWLDLCCGSATALYAAAEIAQAEGFADQLEIVGVDLVRGARRTSLPCVTLVESSLAAFEPARRFDVVTCVHGLHYIADKLSAIARVASWLNDGGRLAASFDAKSIVVDGKPAAAAVAKVLRRHGFSYDSRKKIVSCVGPRIVTWPWNFVGADDQVGPNYTGQEAVDSHYARSGRVEI